MLHLYHNLMEKLREIQELHPDAHFICKRLYNDSMEATEVIVTFRVANFDAFVPMTRIYEQDASFEEVNKLFCNE